jgi:hypothetical protein
MLICVVRKAMISGTHIKHKLAKQYNPPECQALLVTKGMWSVKQDSSRAWPSRIGGDIDFWSNRQPIEGQVTRLPLVRNTLKLGDYRLVGSARYEPLITVISHLCTFLISQESDCTCAKSIFSESQIGKDDNALSAQVPLRILRHGQPLNNNPRIPGFLI